MTKNDKIAVGVVAAIGIVVLIWMMLMRRSSAANTVQPTSNSPGAIGTAYPGRNPWKLAANGLPTPGATASDGCCGCNSGSSGIFNSMGKMLDYFQSKSGSMFDDYQRNVYNAYPDSVSQYFNNPVGASESNRARAVFRE